MLELTIVIDDLYQDKPLHSLTEKLIKNTCILANEHRRLPISYIHLHVSYFSLLVVSGCTYL